MGPCRFEIPECPPAEVQRLRRELGVSGALAQVLVRRGMAEPAIARTFLAGEEEHPPQAFAGIGEAVAAILGHVAQGTRITIHGDYDVDGICSTAVLVRALRELGANVDSYLPDRASDGYGLNATTVQRLAARGTRLLVTVDCAVTAVDEVAAARALGMEVVVTDHHAPRADGELPRAPIVHPALCGYPCRDLCATAVAYKLAQALLEAAARGEARGGARARPERVGAARARAGPRPGGARDDRRRRAAHGREPDARASRAARAGEHDQAGPARADGGRGSRSLQGQRALGRLRARRRG